MRNRNRIRNRNTMLKKIKKDFSSVWSMLSTPTADTSDKSLQDYLATTQEDFKTVEELKESERKISTYANDYINSIGVPTKPNKKSKNEKQNNLTNIPSTSKENTRNNIDLER